MAMLICSLVGALAAAGQVAAAPSIERRAPALALAEHTLPLTRRQGEGTAAYPRPWTQPHRRAAIAATLTDRSENMPADLLATEDPIANGTGKAVVWHNDVEYLTQVKAGSNNLSLIVDTGSSDTWFAKAPFTCYDDYRRKASMAYCLFGKLFEGDFPGGQIPNQHFSIRYGSADGPFMQGPVGYSDLTISGITVPKQQIGLANMGYWPNGDGTASGILGLGLPGLTDAFTGSDTSTDSLSTMVKYNPFVVTMGEQYHPIFSLALSRDPDQSFLSFGGIPPNVKVTGEWGSTPITKVSLRTGPPEHLYYQIAPQKMIWNSSTSQGSDEKPVEMIVDSGTTLNLFPYKMANSINSMFDPPAQRPSNSDTWFVACDAKPPTLGIQLGGKTFYTDPKSMILTKVHPNRYRTDLCATGIGTTPDWPYILGDTFMQGLVTVFDIGDKMEIRVAQRA